MQFKKKILTFLMIGGLIFSSLSFVKAAGYTFTLSSSATTLSPGQSFTVTVNVPGSGMFYASASNATVTPAAQYCDTSCSFSVTVKNAGTATVTITTGQPGTQYEVTAFEDDSPITGSKSISVRVVGSSSNSSSSSSSSSGGTSYVPVQDDRSSNANLASLKIGQGEITPSFSADTTNYSVSLGADVSKINVEAKAEDSKATVSGVGEKEVSAGENIIEIVVTAENGSTKTYTIKANVDEKPLVYLTYNKKELGVVRNLKGVEILSGFTSSPITVEGKEISAWTNEVMQKTIMYLIEEETKEKSFYIYDVEQEKVITPIKPLTIKGKLLYAVDIDKKTQDKEGFIFTDVNVDEMSLKGWKFEEGSLANYTLIYVMDTKGEMQYYLYEENENTLQLYTGTAPITQETYEQIVSDLKQANTLKIVFMVLTGILAILSAGGIWYYLNHRKKK